MTTGEASMTHTTATATQGGPIGSSVADGTRQPTATAEKVDGAARDSIHASSQSQPSGAVRSESTQRKVTSDAGKGATASVTGVDRNVALNRVARQYIENLKKEHTGRETIFADADIKQPGYIRRHIMPVLKEAIKRKEPFFFIPVTLDPDNEGGEPGYALIAIDLNEGHVYSFNPVAPPAPETTEGPNGPCPFTQSTALFDSFRENLQHHLTLLNPSDRVRRHVATSHYNDLGYASAEEAMRCAESDRKELLTGMVPRLQKLRDALHSENLDKLDKDGLHRMLKRIRDAETELLTHRTDNIDDPDVEERKELRAVLERTEELQEVPYFAFSGKNTAQRSNRAIRATILSVVDRMISKRVPGYLHENSEITHSAVLTSAPAQSGQPGNSAFPVLAIMEEVHRRAKITEKVTLANGRERQQTTLPWPPPCPLKDVLAETDEKYRKRGNTPDGVKVLEETAGRRVTEQLRQQNLLIEHTSYGKHPLFPPVAPNGEQIEAGLLAIAQKRQDTYVVTDFLPHKAGKQVNCQLTDHILKASLENKRYVRIAIPVALSSKCEGKQQDPPVADDNLWMLFSCDLHTKQSTSVLFVPEGVENPETTLHVCPLRSCEGGRCEETVAKMQEDLNNTFEEVCYKEDLKMAFLHKTMPQSTALHSLLQRGDQPPIGGGTRKTLDQSIAGLSASLYAGDEASSKDEFGEDIYDCEDESNTIFPVRQALKRRSAANPYLPSVSEVRSLFKVLYTKAGVTETPDILPAAACHSTRSISAKVRKGLFHTGGTALPGPVRELQTKLSGMLSQTKAGSGDPDWNQLLEKLCNAKNVEQFDDVYAQLNEKMEAREGEDRETKNRTEKLMERKVNELAVFDQSIQGSFEPEVRSLRQDMPEGVGSLLLLNTVLRGVGSRPEKELNRDAKGLARVLGGIYNRIGVILKEVKAVQAGKKESAPQCPIS
ncbi:MAG: hypothetical protein OXF02_07190 [Simkaniaceae bacterium]|nr:hypothetical protein [Simkaniaceae bacterium]